MPTDSDRPATGTSRGPLVRRVIHVLYPGFKLLDVAGPLQVFADAAEYARGRGHYRVKLASAEGGKVASDTGIPLETVRIGSLRIQPRDALIVPGGDGVYAAAEDPALVAWLRSRAERAGLVASTCTGAFLLGAAGLLENRRAATHWRRCGDLQARFPTARVEPDPIFIVDRGVWTSAGVTASIDLSLAVVEQDLGRAVALELARNLVVYYTRPGGQAQFSQHLQHQIADASDLFDSLHHWIERHLADDLRVERLAKRCDLTPRTFHRLYTKRTGKTPARAVAQLRMEAARRLLEESAEPLKTIAFRCGFGGEEQMRRTFQRELGMSPSAYRDAWSRRPE